MSKLFQVYGIGQALIPVLPPPIAFENAPTSSQTNYSVGQVVYTPGPTANAFYMYAGAGNWVEFATSSGSITAVNGTSNEITASTTSGVVTLSLPLVTTAPGSLSSTTSLSAGTSLSSGTSITSGTTITATLGNITATNGNFVSSTSGKGIVLNPVVVTAAASPQTANGRSFSVTFSGVSIAAGATQSFIINNTSVNTLALISMVGATAGSALTVESITYVSGTSITIVVTNGAGATTSTANITFTGLCLN